MNETTTGGLRAVFPRTAFVMAPSITAVLGASIARLLSPCSCRVVVAFAAFNGARRRGG